MVCLPEEIPRLQPFKLLVAFEMKAIFVINAT